jgi:hypothetical protein
MRQLPTPFFWVNSFGERYCAPSSTRRIPVLSPAVQRTT